LSLDYVADINTGLTYTETYKKTTNPWKTNANNAACYIDGRYWTVLEFAHCAIQVNLGILNDPRPGDFWRVLVLLTLKLLGQGPSYHA
jgi:hypothetical protein